MFVDYDIYVSNFFNSLTTGTCGCNFKNIIFRLVSQNGSSGIHHKIVLWWMPQNLTNEKATLVQVMAWCSQETSHYLIQHWPRSMSPYCLIRPQWADVPTYVPNCFQEIWIYICIRNLPSKVKVKRCRWEEFTYKEDQNIIKLTHWPIGDVALIWNW